MVKFVYMTVTEYGSVLVLHGLDTNGQLWVTNSNVSLENPKAWTRLPMPVEETPEWIPGPKGAEHWLDSSAMTPEARKRWFGEYKPEAEKRDGTVELCKQITQDAVEAPNKTVEAVEHKQPTISICKCGHVTSLHNSYGCTHNWNGAYCDCVKSPGEIVLLAGEPKMCLCGHAEYLHTSFGCMHWADGSFCRCDVKPENFYPNV